MVAGATIGGNGVGAELKEPEIALDILRAVAIVGVRGIPFVDVAQRVDLGGDVVADEQGVARPRCVQRVIFLHEGQLLISRMEEQALRGAEGHDLTRAMPHELVAATVVGQTEVVDVAFLYFRECLEGQLGAQLVEVAQLVVLSPARRTLPRPNPSLCPFPTSLGSHPVGSPGLQLSSVSWVPPSSPPQPRPSARRRRL